jgi:precorrin-6A/cobalt-precorrin-6A reductase
MTNILILGGTKEARELCLEVNRRNIRSIVSYAGRVTTVETQPLPSRIGGFGGVAGMVDFITQQRITHLIDATHPFAKNISENAIKAAKITGTRFATLERPEWVAGPEDNWIRVKNVNEAVNSLNKTSERIFLAIGKQNIGEFMTQDQHFYLLRFVEEDPLKVFQSICHVIYAKGPFKYEDDKKILLNYKISKVITKNSGGNGVRAKIDAARVLKIPVVMIDRPIITKRIIFTTVEEVLSWVAH